MANKTTVSFTHMMADSYLQHPADCLLYEKYDTKGISFDLSSLHSYAYSYEINIYIYYSKNSSYTSTWNGTVAIGLNPYTTGGSTAYDSTPTTTINFSTEMSGGQHVSGGQWINVTFKDTDAVNQNILLDKPFYICKYSFLNPPSGSGYTLSSTPLIGRVIRRYKITYPSSGEKITHSDLTAFATWCKMSSATHATNNSILAAADSNRPWGINVSMVNERGSLVTTSNTYAKTAGTNVEYTWIYNALSDCNSRSWVR